MATPTRKIPTKTETGNSGSIKRSLKTSERSKEEKKLKEEVEQFLKSKTSKGEELKEITPRLYIEGCILTGLIASGRPIPMVELKRMVKEIADDLL